MDENKLKELLADVQKGVTAEVYEKLLKEFPNRKDIFGKADEATQTREMKEKTAEYIKAKYFGDRAQSKALSGGEATAGAELVPEYFASEVIRIAGKYGHVRRDARLYPMASDTLNVPTAGTVTAYRVAEKAAITASQPTTGSVQLVAQELAVLIPVSNQLLADANVGVVDLLTTLSGEALASKEDEWGIEGLSSGEGIFQDSNVNVVTMDSGDDAFTDVNADYLLDLLNQIDENALDGGKWYMTFSVFNLLRKVKDTTGQYIVQQPANGMPATIWNFPVALVSTMPKSTDDAAATKFLAFGNLKYMLFGDRQQMSIDISNQATVVDSDNTTLNLFQRNMSAVRVIERIDIELAEADKAFAVLKTAAS